MAAGKLDLLIQEGATFYKTFKVKVPGQPAVPPNPTTGEAGKPAVAERVIPLNGQVISAEIRKDYFEKSTLIAAFTGRIINAEQGVFALELSAATTTDLIKDADKGADYDGGMENLHVGYYDVELHHGASGFVTRLMEGRILYSDEITRS
jgi:hypothetical protein